MGLLLQVCAQLRLSAQRLVPMRQEETPRPRGSVPNLHVSLILPEGSLIAWPGSRGNGWGGCAASGIRDSTKRESSCPGPRPGGTPAVITAVNKHSRWLHRGPGSCPGRDQGRWDSCDYSGVGSAIVSLLSSVPRRRAPETPVTAEITWQAEQNVDSSRPPVKPFNA